MKFKSKIGDGLFISLVVFSVITLSMFVLWVITGVWWPAITLTAILLIIIAPIYFCTYYEITRNELRVYSGILGKSIEYRNIISMTDAESVRPSFALSHKRIMIRYMENEKIKSIYVSPANREQFRDVVTAEISKSTEIYKKAPKNAQTKAIEKARKEHLENPTLDKSELRAQTHSLAQQEEYQRKAFNKELGNLDNVINANVADKSNIQSIKTTSVEQRKKAEQKLLAKIRKLKEKQTRKEAKIENKRNAEIAKQDKVKRQELENLRKQKAKQDKETSKAQAKETKQNIPTTEQPKADSPKNQSAMKNVEKDQIEPQKADKKQPKASAEIHLEIEPKNKKQAITEIQIEQKPTKKSTQSPTSKKQEPLKKDKPVVDEKTAKKQQTKTAKKEKVAEAKKSKAVVKNTKSKK